MEFTIARDNFRVAVQRTLGIADRKTVIPILNNILLKTDGQRIKIVATDRELSLISRYDATVSREGEITVLARKLFDIIKEFPGGIVRFEVDDNGQVRITLGRIMYRISGLAAQEFPTILETEDIPTYPIKGEVLIDLIDKTVYASSSDELRTNMNGVFLETEESVNGIRLKMVATDGHRMAIAYSEPEEHGGMLLEKGVLVPRRGVTEMKRLVEGAKDSVRLGVDKGALMVTIDGTTLKVSLIDMEFPEYRRAIPSDKGVALRINRDALLHALRRMSVVATDRYGGVVITLRDNCIILNSNNPDLGEATEELEVVYQGEEVTMGYNVRYLMEAVEAVDEEELLFEMRAGNKPGVVRKVGSDQYASYIMPLRL